MSFEDAIDGRNKQFSTPTSLSLQMMMLYTYLVHMHIIEVIAEYTWY